MTTEPTTEPTNEDIARALGFEFDTCGWSDQISSGLPHWHDNDSLPVCLESLPNFATAEMCDRWIIPDCKRRGWKIAMAITERRTEVDVASGIWIIGSSYADTPWRALVLAWWRAVESEKEGKS